MPETEAVETETVEQEPSTDEPTTKPTETVEFWKQKARTWEERAKENSRAREELDVIKAAQLSTEEREAKEKADAIRERDEARQEALRWRIAAKHSISDEDAELFLTGTDEETLTKQAQRFSVLAPKPGKGNVIPNLGNQPEKPPSLADQIRLAEQSGDKALAMQLKSQQLADLAKK
ncbi:hypothetical protein [Mycolicibacterium sp.]|uniref:hypothetical protein n=1 Tax=Mycolicibacterium sp. TaxID=2320850 RepID=UPI0037CAF5C2